MTRKIGILLIAVIALASCGKQQDSAVSVDAAFDAHALAASADHTTEAHTGKAHLTMSIGMTGPGRSSSTPSPLSLSVTGDGSYDSAAGLSSMTVDLGSALSGLLGRARSDSTLGATASQTMETIRHDQVTYLRTPMLSTIDPALADKWIKVDTNQLAPLGTAKQSTSPLSSFPGMGDPSAFLDYLKGAGGEVTTVGHEQVDGVDTTHVHATLSMKQAHDAAGADRDKLNESLKNMPGGIGASIESLTLPVDAYVDADGYVRRIAIDYDFGDLFKSLGDKPAGPTGSSMPSGLGMTMTLTVDFSDFGMPVTITEPSADQTVSMCDLYAHLPSTSKTRPTIPAGMC
jgi:hypothetical protein